MIRRTGLLAALAALGFPAAASAWTVDTLRSLSAGPALAGEATVWATTHSETMLAVKRSVAGEAPANVFTVPRRANCDRIEDLAASAQAVAVRVQRTPGGYSCDDAGEELYVSSPGGAKRIEGTTAECAPHGFDVDGGLLAVSQFCDADPVVVHDLATGAVTDLGFTFDKYDFPRAVRIAGRYLAYRPGKNGFDMPGTDVIVWDRLESREVYRVDSATLAQPGDEPSGTHFELQPDGRLLVGMRVPGSEFAVHRWGWASPAEPTLHPIAGVYVMPFGRAAFVGDLAAVHQSNGTGGVIGLDGRLLNRFTREPVGNSIDFDGTRLVWEENGLVHNEAYPFTPSAPAPLHGGPLPPSKPPAATGVAPVARATAPRSGKAKALKAFSGTAADADGDLALVRVGLVRTGKRCETLQKSGRLVRAKLTGGKCLPTVWLTATGTGNWKLKLRRRLPTGKYALYVQGVDRAGHAQVAFTKALGSLRSFTLR